METAFSETERVRRLSAAPTSLNIQWALQSIEKRQAEHQSNKSKGVYASPMADRMASSTKAQWRVKSIPHLTTKNWRSAKLRSWDCMFRDQSIDWPWTRQEGAAFPPESSLIAVPPFGITGTRTMGSSIFSITSFEFWSFQIWTRDLKDLMHSSRGLISCSRSGDENAEAQPKRLRG